MHHETTVLIQVIAPLMAVCAIALLAFRRFMIQTWWFLSRHPYGRLLDFLLYWHAEKQTPITYAEIDHVFERVHHARNRQHECDLIKQEYLLGKS